jgi:YVTN family beta-propeller protein
MRNEARALILVLAMVIAAPARAGRIGAEIPVGPRDRVYAAEQYSNTVSVIDPSVGTLLGEIRLGDPQPVNMSPLYRGQLLVHGLGFSPDHRTLAVVSIGSNSVTFIDTESNAMKHISYLGRSPHEAFFTPDGKDLWVSIRGEDYISVLNAKSYEETMRIKVGNGPGMTIFSPDGRYGYVCSSFTPETVVVETSTHSIVGRVKQESPFCPNIAVTPEGDQVWFTLKDVGKVQVFGARPPFALIKTLDSGPITNHVSIVRNVNGEFAYVTVGGLNQVQVYRTDTFDKVATISTGDLPHGIWPSGDGTRVYVGLENSDAVVAIDSLENRVLQTIPVGQAPQALVYVSGAVQSGDGTQNLQPLGVAGNAVHLKLADTAGRELSTVSLFDQGITQVMQAAVTGLAPRKTYVLALADDANGKGTLEPLSNFTTNPAGAAIVTAVGPVRQVVHPDAGVSPRRFVVVAPITDGKVEAVVQVQR